MLQHLDCTPENERLISRLTPIYQVGHWANFGVFMYPFSGYYTEDGKEPMVWFYDDHNGEREEYRLIPISATTTGTTICWTFNQITAEKLAKALQTEEYIRRTTCD